MRRGATKTCWKAVRSYALPAMQTQGAIAAWFVDDTGFPKKGTHSVGVTRQDCGQVGKEENCRVAVSRSISTAAASLPIAWRLHLPEVWAKDKKRRRAAGVPEEIAIATKPALALQQIRWAVEREIPQAPVLADAAYGTDTRFREGITELGLPYVLGIMSSVTVWKPGQGPLPKPAWKGAGRPPRYLQRDQRRAPLAVKALALALPAGCPTISALGSTEPNQFRYPRRPRYFVKQESGGLLLLRRITPLPRRNTVYFCSGAYKKRCRSSEVR